MRWIVSMLLLLFSIQCVDAQENKPDSTSQKFTFHLNADSFLKNNEYFSPHTDGFTGIGLILQPHSRYQIDQNSSITLGYHFLKFSGLNSFSEAIPLITIQTSLYKGWTLLLGTIKGAAKHKLTEPLYRIDNDYQNQIEYGIQSLFDYEWINADIWLHWEQFIKKDDPFPEEVFVGSTSRILIKTFDSFRLHLNSEFLVSHLGGQIDASDNPDRTVLNYSLGPSVTLSAGSTLDITFKYQYYKSSIVKQVADNQSPLFIPFDSGHAHYPQVRIKSGGLQISTGYWSSESFVSPRGEFLFSSLSDINPLFLSSVRHLWTNMLTYDSKPFPYLALSVFGITYYDSILNHIDYSYGLRAIVKLDF